MISSAGGRVKDAYGAGYAGNAASLGLSGVRQPVVDHF
jgi:hypothetical protein